MKLIIHNISVIATGPERYSAREDNGRLNLHINAWILFEPDQPMIICRHERKGKEVPWSSVVLLFVMSTEADNRKVSTDDVIVKIMHADDLATITIYVQEAWTKNLVGHQRDELNYMLEGNEIKQVKQMCRDKGICK